MTLSTLLALVARLLITITVLAFGSWATLAAAYSNLPGGLLRLLAAVCVAVVTGYALLRLRHQFLPPLGFLLVVVGVLVLWIRIRPSNERTWSEDVSVLAAAELDGESVTLRRMRQFRHFVDGQDGDRRVEKGWGDRVFDLSSVREAEILVSYWGLKSIAHTFLSFGFDDGERLTVSVEVRREEGESYSPLRGLFKQYELVYVLADERDAVRLRAVARSERVWLFPTTLSRDSARALLVDILQRANRLAVAPEFYATLFSNCTTNLVDHLDRVLEQSTPYHRKILLNGYSPELAYESGLLPTDRSWEELRRDSEITEVARELPDDENFSRALRDRIARR